MEDYDKAINIVEKDDCHSNQKQIPDDEQIDRTKTIIGKLNVRKTKELVLTYNEYYANLIADILENSIETCLKKKELMH